MTNLLRSRQVLAVPTPGRLYDTDASGVSAGILPSNSQETKEGVADVKGFTAKMAPVDATSPSQQTPRVDTPLAQPQQQVPAPQVPQQAGNTKRWYAPNYDGLWQRR